MRALRIDTDGTFVELDMPNGELALLDAMQTAVGGYYTVHMLPGAMTLWCDEDAPFKPGLEANPSATAAMDFLGKPMEMLRGPVVIGGASGRNGKLQPLTREQSGKLEDFLAAICPHSGTDD